MKKILTLNLLIIIFFSSCITHAYYLSPFNANADPYHTIPLQSDSIKAATYTTGVFTAGGANDGWHDGIYAFQGGIHRSHNFGNFQAYYGANLSIGAYHVNEYYRSEHPYYDSITFHIPATNNFFGAYGFNGGINAVLPFRNGGEWRVIGLETSVQKEFGNYLDFRKNLPDSAADIIFRKNVTGTIGLCTDIISRSRHGAEFGYKMAWGFTLNPQSDYSHTYSQNNVNPIVYFSQTWHLTKGNITGFVQLNLGSYAGNMQFGMNCKLGKNKITR